jgi:hypothetical protein
MKSPYVKKYRVCGKLNIFLVDGELVRNTISDDFTLAGHGLVYDYIPKDEVWLESTIKEHEIPIILVHEMLERVVMHGGIDYDSAHELANDIEILCRDKKVDTEDTLSILGKQRI